MTIRLGTNPTPYYPTSTGVPTSTSANVTYSPTSSSSLTSSSNPTSSTDGNMSKEDLQKLKDEICSLQRSVLRLQQYKQEINEELKKVKNTLSNLQQRKSKGEISNDKYNELAPELYLSIFS